MYCDSCIQQWQWESLWTRVRFNGLWFVFDDSSSSFHEPYFSRKHIFHESFGVNRTQDYGLKTRKHVRNYPRMSWFWKHSYRRFPASSNFLPSQLNSNSNSFCKHHFYGAGNNKLIRRGDLTIQAFIYHLI